MPDRIIKFRQYREAPEYRYLLTERQALLGDFIYKRENGAFLAIQRVLTEEQLKESHPVVIKTDNPNYILIYDKDLEKRN